jgi:hypothetical protein
MSNDTKKHTTKSRETIPLTRVSGAQVNLFDEKTYVQNLVSVSLLYNTS